MIRKGIIVVMTLAGSGTLVTWLIAHYAFGEWGDGHHRWYHLADITIIGLRNTILTKEIELVGTCWIPFPILFILLMAYPFYAFIQGPLFRYRCRRKGICLKCGYNFKGYTTDICPECSQKFTRNEYMVIGTLLGGYFGAFMVLIAVSFNGNLETFIPYIYLFLPSAFIFQLIPEQEWIYIWGMYIFIALNGFFYMVIGSGIGYIAWARKQSILRRTFPYCSKCGYNLTGNESGVCPECGTEIKA